MVTVAVITVLYLLSAAAAAGFLVARTLRLESMFTKPGCESVLSNYGIAALLGLTGPFGVAIAWWSAEYGRFGWKLFALKRPKAAASKKPWGVS